MSELMFYDTAILQIMQAKGLGYKTLNQVLTLLDGRSPEELISATSEEITSRFGLKKEIASAIKAGRQSAELLANDLEGNGIHILVRGQANYPQKLTSLLGNTAPPVLFAKGNLSILEQKAVGFCGSRKASEKGLHVAYESAKLLAEEKINIVSGYAHGVDLAAHRAALEAGGVTTLVLAEGILKYTAKKEIAKLIDEHNSIIISEFSPRLSWVASSAMQRNRTICGLSDAMIVIESGLTGGTFAAGQTALEFKRPLFVANYATPAASAEGNAYFIKLGAKSFGSKDGKPNVSGVLDMLEMSKNETAPSVPSEINELESVQQGLLPGFSVASEKTKSENGSKQSANDSKKSVISSQKSLTIYQRGREIKKERLSAAPPVSLSAILKRSSSVPPTQTKFATIHSVASKSRMRRA